MLEQTLGDLRDEHTRSGKGELFDHLKVFLTGDEDAPTYAEIARHLGMSEDAVKMAVSRLRKRFRETLRAQIAHTVANPADADDELRHLLAALA